MAADTLSDWGKVRVWLHIPLVSDSAAVRAITDPVVCERLRAAFAKSDSGLPPSSALSVVVVQAGTVYAVLDPSQWCGEWIKAGVYDDSFRELALFLY